MLRPEFVRRKAVLIAEDLALLDRFRELTYEALVGDAVTLAAVERIIERIVMRAVDANQHLVATLTPGDAPRARLTYAESFRRLPALGVMPPEVADAVAPSAGLRNVLVHDYNDVRHLHLFEAIGACLRDYPPYAEALLDFADRAGATDA